MWQRVENSKRRRLILCLMLALSLLLFAVGDSASAQPIEHIYSTNQVPTTFEVHGSDSLDGTCGAGYDMRGGAPLACPTPRPVCEMGQGSSLYWQDICRGGYRGDEPLIHNATRPGWYLSIEAVSLIRDQQGSTNLQPVAPNATVGISTDGFDTEFAGGAKVALGRSVGDWYRVDFSWLGGFDWSDTVNSQSASVFQTIVFNTQMNTAEINLRRRVRIRDFPQHYPDYYSSFEFSTILGLRFFDLQERIDYRVQVPPGVNAANASTENQAFGVQIGGLAQWLYEDRGWLDLEMKGGILSNAVSVQSLYSPTFGSDDTFAADEDQTAFLVDASMVFNYQFTPTATFRLGYNMIWVSGVALASDNISPDATTPIQNVNHDGESIFHGPSIGLVLTR